MTQLLYTKIKKYLEANSKTVSEFERNIEIVIDNENPEINYESLRKWDVSGLAKPTEEQLNSYESEATTEENNLTVIVNRKSEYGTNTQQIENIIENGLVAEQARVQAIKDKYPK